VLRVPSLRGADCNTDGFVVLAIVRERVSEIKQAAQKFHVERLNVMKLDQAGGGEGVSA